MCDPTIIGVALSAASTLMTIKSESDQADIENQRQEDNFAAQKVAADAAYANAANQETTAIMQRDIANSREVTESQKEATKAAGTATVSAGEAGVSGVSLDHLLGDFKRTEAQFADATSQQFEFDQQATLDSLDGHIATRANRINSARPEPVAKPSYLAGALKIAGSAIGNKDFRKGVNGMFSSPAPSPKFTRFGGGGAEGVGS